MKKIILAIMALLPITAFAQFNLTPNGFVTDDNKNYYVVDVDGTKEEFVKQLKEILIADGDCLVGRNELGKILMEIRDNKTINYNFKHKVFLMDTEIV